MKTGFVNKISGLFNSVKTYWKTPPKDRYMSYKEILSLSFGGLGVKFIIYCLNTMTLYVGNTLIGNTIGIDPKPLYVIYIISVIAGFPLTAIRARMIDNSRSMKGKYRPYILTMGLPTVILGIGFIWMPYEHMSLMVKCIVVLLFNIGFQFFFMFYKDSYESILNVLSPNTVERSDVNSIKAVVENFAPSIANIILPLFAKLITGENTLYDIKIYRIMYPVMIGIGFVFSMLIYVNTEEKIIQARTHTIQLKFIDAFRAIAKNKYFWIISLAGWIGFLENSFNSILGWMYSYQNACSPGQYSLIVAIIGNASFWPMLIVPYLVRKTGKRSILVISNILNIVFIGLMVPAIKMTGSNKAIWLLFICTFANQFTTTLSYMLTPSINADVRDYQQYVTGERIDGMFSAVGLIGSVVMLATSFVLPQIYSSAGLNQTVAKSLGYNPSNVYDVLYNKEYFISICTVLVIASIVGSALNVIPYFFYDLTESKQKAMIKVLKIRAMFEDFGNNVLSDKLIAEVIDIVNEAKKYDGKIPENKAEAEKIESSKFVLEELNKFNTEFGIIQIENAQRIAAAGLNGFLDAFSITMKEAKAMPKNTAKEKELRKEMITQVQYYKIAKRTIEKRFPNGIKEFDASIFDTLFKSIDENEIAQKDTLNNIKKAKEIKNHTPIPEYKAQLKALRKQKSELEAQLKAAINENSLYTRATKPYAQALKLIQQKNNYEHFDKIVNTYMQSQKYNL